MSSTMAKKRDEGARVSRGFRFSNRAVQALDRLVEQYRADAPSCLDVNQRMILEALIDYAETHEIPFSELVGMTAAVGAESQE